MRTQRRERGFFLSHLLGDYSLPRSFWVHTILLGWLFGALTAHVAARIADAYPARYSSLAAMLSPGGWQELLRGRVLTR